jgi:hypothetical protein
MSTSHDTEWHHVRFNDVVLDVPAAVAASSEQAVEGSAAVFEGGGLRVTLDASPFADPVTGHESRPGFRRWHEEIGGHRRDVVAYDSSDGGTVVAARLPGPLTAAVHVAAGADPAVAQQILRSISQQGEHDER